MLARDGVVDRLLVEGGPVDRLLAPGGSLDRLLAEDGLSFSAVRERTLEQLAVRALERGERVSDVALRLGYSDETAFARAAVSRRRWCWRHSTS